LVVEGCGKCGRDGKRKKVKEDGRREGRSMNGRQEEQRSAQM
jgi:hypothetical protein